MSKRRTSSCRTRVSKRRTSSRRTQAIPAKVDEDQPDITLEDLWGRLISDDPASRSDAGRFLGVCWLTEIAQAEFGVELDRRSLNWLRGLLARLDPQVDPDTLDAMTADHAATLLKVARQRSAPHRLADLFDLQALEDHSRGNLMPATCPRCDGPWSTERRAWRRLCERCTSFEGTVLELDVAIKTERRELDLGRDPLDRQFPDWKPINAYLREKYNVPMIRAEDWERFALWIEVTHGIDRGRLLAMPLVELAEMVRRIAADASAGVLDLVTLDQAAAMAHSSKRTLERYKEKGELPAPAVPRGGGRADLYDWKVMGPWLESTFSIKQPAVFPANRRHA
jgi:hypothetical protein